VCTHTQMRIRDRIHQTAAGAASFALLRAAMLGGLLIGPVACGHESPRVEESNGVGRGAGACEICKNLADDGDELEPVSREAARHGDVGVAVGAGDDEVLVGGVGVHAGRGVNGRSREGGEQPGDPVAHLVDFLRIHGAVDGLGGAHLALAEEVDRLARLVDRLLTLSRAETGQAPLSREIVHLQVLAEEVVQHLSVLAEEKQQQIVVERRAAPDALADKQVLRHALINLVDNAIKFTPRGGSVRIRISETPASAIFDVIDTGPGVPEAARAHIFDRFYRADEGDGMRGAGLGLSIAKGAVEANGGRLTLEASSPSGSTFRITMPRVAPARRQAV